MFQLLQGGLRYGSTVGVGSIGFSILEFGVEFRNEAQLLILLAKTREPLWWYSGLGLGVSILTH